MESYSIAGDPRSRLVDRELAWLAFNERVLELAEDEETPLLERCRFLAIFSSNLDDFYQIRFATLISKIENGYTKPNTAGFSPAELALEITEKTRALVDRQAKTFHVSILPSLEREGITIESWENLKAEEKNYLNEIFRRQIFPVLTPLVVDPAHPFPYISGLSLNIGIVLEEKDSDEEFFARVKVPNNLARFIPTSKDNLSKFVPIEEIIIANLHELFHGVKVRNQYMFRVTRNADLEIEEEDSEDLLASMEQELLRRKFGPPVRLEVDAEIDDDLLEEITAELLIDPQDVIRTQSPLDLTSLTEFADLELPQLKFPAWSNQIAPDLRSTDMENDEVFFNAIRSKEILLHHPYESFNSSVVRFLESASRDPKVLAIKQTLYRTSGDSPIVQALIKAAEAGKQVLAVVEIRARFDEQANVLWARKLEEVGVHVVYGLVGFKTHAKLSLVVRQEENQIRQYVHMGTGNYHPKTARLYEDIGLLSADPVLSEDVNKLFNQLSGYAPNTDFKRILVAPRTLRSGLLERIEKEIESKKAGKPAGIRFKINSILDEEFIEALYKASQNGVSVDLIVRGICSIRSGVEGLSENIRVRSTLGRFLEHSRIYHFVDEGRDEYWIGSADLMHRNLDRRVEALVRIENLDHKIRLSRALNGYMDDSSASWHQESDGSWRRVKIGENGEVLQDFQVKALDWYRKRG